MRDSFSLSFWLWLQLIPVWSQFIHAAYATPERLWFRWQVQTVVTGRVFRSVCQVHMGIMNLLCICTGVECCCWPDRIKQRLPDILSVSVPQTRPTELTLNPPTVLTATACLRVNSFLTALMTCRALKIHKETSTTKTVDVYTDLFVVLGFSNWDIATWWTECRF